MLRCETLPLLCAHLPLVLHSYLQLGTVRAVLDQASYASEGNTTRAVQLKEQMQPGIR